MKPAPTLSNDGPRCDSLHALNLLDTPAEERFDRITRLAQKLFDVPVVLISLVDEQRQWFKSAQGIGTKETSRSISFCGHAIASDSAFVVEDASLDDRFSDNPLVVGEPHIQFYAGQPLRAASGLNVGTLCLIDFVPRQFSGDERNQLRDLALLVEAEFRRDPDRLGGGDPTERRDRPRMIGGGPSRVQRLGSQFTSTARAAVLSALVGLTVMVGGGIWEFQQLKAYQGRVKNDVVQRLSLVRGTIESALNAKVHLVHALSGYVHAGGRADNVAFARLAAELAESVGSIRSLQLAPGGVVTYVWPLEINQRAIGHDLLADSERRGAAAAAIKARRIWLAGPMELIQGGQALIARLPIFVAENEVERFWGFATALIDMPGLWQEVGLRAADEDYRYALRGRDALGASGAVFFGDSELFLQSPIIGSISLPAGSWELAMVPRGGWPQSWPGEWSFRAGVVVLAGIVVLLVFFLLRLPTKMRRAIAMATSAFERSESQFRDAIEALPDGIVIYDANDFLAVCNENYRELYRPCRPRLQAGRHYADVLRFGLTRGLIDGVQADSQEQIEAYIASAMQRRAGRYGEYEERLADGRIIQVVERRMRDGGIVSFYMDVTRQKADEFALVEARERAEQANRTKSAFLATVSHEVRTPLNGVLGLLSVLGDDQSLSEQQLEYVKTAHNSALHLLEILNEILDLSKLEADKLELDQNVFSLEQTLQGTVHLVEAQARLKGLELQTEIDAILSRRVIGDEGRLRQIVLNLLSNAIKFTDAGTVKLRASASVLDDRLRVLIEVEDTGIGFDTEQANRLFETFTQLDTNSARRFTGTGLGLAISKRLVQLMAGQIGAEGRPGEGATFRINLEFPLAAEVSPEQPATPEVLAPLPADVGWPTVRILLAEDSPTNQMVIRAMLNNTGYVVDAVHNGQEAVTAARQLCYDLILMDVYMPEMDGITATREIRQLKEGHMPIIALTANAMQGDADRFLDAGMDAYLPKPVNKQQLLKQLYESLRPRLATHRETGSGPSVEAQVEGGGT